MYKSYNRGLQLGQGGYGSEMKKIINENAAEDCYTSCSTSFFCLFCKIEVVTFYHLTCCLM